MNTVYIDIIPVINIFITSFVGVSFAANNFIISWLVNPIIKTISNDSTDRIYYFVIVRSVS